MVLPQASEASTVAPSLGVVEGIYIASVADAPMQSRELVRAETGRGLEGDRYFAGLGTYSTLAGTGRDVTLIAAEALEDLAEKTGIRFEHGESRRNIVTRGVELLELVGKRFWVGNVLLEGMRDCPPCNHMERLTGQPGAARGLIHQGGLRAEIRQSGTIQVGDSIRLAHPERVRS